MALLISDAEFAERMVEKYRNLLLECAGHSTVMVDGLQVSYRDLKKEYDQWRKELAKAANGRPAVSAINLSS